MRFKPNKTSILFFVLAVSLMSIARVNDPPNGRTGAPGDGLCTDCHNGGSSGQDGSVVIEGLPANLDPSTTYSITVTVNNPDESGQHGGFQLVALDEANDDAGTMANAGSSSKITPSGSRTYFEHSPAQTFGGGNSVSYTVDWTSPSGPDMEGITLYAAGNVSNGNGGTGGDLIVTTSVTGVLEQGVGPLEVSIIESNNVLCNGESTGFARAEATGGTPDYMYEWSDGQTGDAAINLEAGDYSVVVTDQDGNMSTADISITEPTAVSGSVSDVTDARCNGEENGSATVSGAGGVGPYTYLWPDGSTDPTNSSLGADSYDVIITDVNLCDFTQVVNISEPEILVGAVLNQENVSCNGLNDGSAQLAVAGGTMPYLFEWDNDLIGNEQMDLEAGSYTITVTDFQMCTEIILVDISEPEAVQIEVIEEIMIACNGDSTGVIEILAVGGTGTLSIQWSNGETTNRIENLNAGMYNVVVTDENECTAGETIELMESAPIDIMISSTNETGAGSMDGTASTDPSGGTAPYSYLWSNGDTTQNIDGLPEGNYSVVVTDDNDCTAMASTTVNGVNCTLETRLESTNVACNGDSTGSICVIVDLGTLPFSFLWSDGSTDSCRIDIRAGDYMVTITDADNCSNLMSVTISEPQELIVTSSETGNLCNGDSDARIEIFVQGGVEPYDVQPASVLTDLPAGAYTFTVLDGNDCEASITVDIIDPPVIEIVLDSSRAEFNTDPGSGALYVTSTGGTGTLTFEWSDLNGLVVSTDEDLIDVAAGTYQLTVMDENGCFMIIASDVEFLVAVSDPIRVQQLKVFPNPSSDYIAVRMPRDESIESMRWLSPTGEIQEIHVYDLSGGMVRLPLDQRPQGISFLEIVTSNSKYIEKILKQ